MGDILKSGLNGTSAQEMREGGWKEEKGSLQMKKKLQMRRTGWNREHKHSDYLF